jgi:GNAT superfamily N-acetyltransferase
MLVPVLASAFEAHGGAKVPQLRERLHDRALSPDPPGTVAFDGDRAVGWVSLGPRTDFERIVRSRVIPRVDDRPVWSIVCFAVSESGRRRGVTRALLDAAIDHARQRGADALEAYPVATDADEPIHPGAAFTGTLPLFEWGVPRRRGPRLGPVEPASARRRASGARVRVTPLRLCSAVLCVDSADGCSSMG